MGPFVFQGRLGTHEPARTHHLAAFSAPAQHCRQAKGSLKCRAEVSKNGYVPPKSGNRGPEASTSDAGTGQGEESPHWQSAAVPTYLQNDTDDFCQDWVQSVQSAERKKSQDAGSKEVVSPNNPVWSRMRKEAADDASTEPLLSSFLYASILSHYSFKQALATVLANRLSDSTMLATELYEIFHDVLEEHPELQQAALADISAVRERDPACTAYMQAMLYYKGFHAVQVHRVANRLWHARRRTMALALQARVSEGLGIDIHPCAVIGQGLLLDHGTGVVIGATAVVGNNVSILHNVTLGGTGKDAGDRHPKIGDNVLIGAAATILGNITVVGEVKGNPALKMQHWMRGIESRPSASSLGEFCDNLERTARENPAHTRSIAQSASQNGAGQASRARAVDSRPIAEKAGRSGVESTRSDKKADKKWPVKEDPEFQI
ncbi:hypothetical protein WJX73_000529 [Symbiochloris irregularis]|uniref:Serine acetyltransferase N-terminal domain-containing protein n=1 Tax=Symbiochloris irregularis TaxID=706552 RepID=A0AAW1NSV2_9CHLO